MGKFFEVRNPKIILRRLKNKPVLRYLRVQAIGICDWTDAEKYKWPDRKCKINFCSFSIVISLSVSQK